MKERFNDIDLLRAFSIVGVMAIHTLSFQLSTPFALVTWNSLQFVVGAFVFCSGFVHGHYNKTLSSFSAIISWYKKRKIRILLPFYIYFLIHFLLFLLFPNIFHNFGMQKNIWFVIGSVFLYGGINTNWLPLLFLELTLITPLIFYLFKKNLLQYFLGFCIVFTLIGTIYIFPYGLYKILMWPAWLLLFVLGMIAYEHKEKVTKAFIALGVGGVAIFTSLFFLWPTLGRSINFSDNKYPPNFYYISFAISGTILAFFLCRWAVGFLPTWTYSYLSKKSYNLFFIHYIVLDCLLYIDKTFWQMPIATTILLVVGTSLAISLLLDFVGKHTGLNGLLKG